jgi:hypothetical protein
LRIIDDDRQLQTLGAALSYQEQLVFENRFLHDFFYDHVLWRSREQMERSGFYWKTLEFLPHQLPAIRLLRSWPLVRFLNRFFHISEQIGRESAQKYARSGAIGALIIEEKSPVAWVRAGQATERLWLMATELGISLQPAAGILYLMEHINTGNTSAVYPEEAARIREACTIIHESFDAAGASIPMVVRLGYADEPSARTERLPLKHFLVH